MRVQKQLILLLAVTILFVALFTTSASADACWQYDENQTGCEAAISSGEDCQWQNSTDHPWCQGTGCCEQLGCWDYDGDQSACGTTPPSMGCSWEPNNANQNPGCWIQSTIDTDSGLESDVGCCQMQGCWNRDGTNQTYCEDTNFLEGSCTFKTQAEDPWCPFAEGCCQTPWCGDSSVDTQAKCESLIDMDMPCAWSGSECQDLGCHAYDDDVEECTDNDWCSWDPVNTSCFDPWMEGGAGGGGPLIDMDQYFDDQNLHCWFADNNPEVCLNVTGCTYCNSTNVQDPTSFCYSMPQGYCQGHEPSWTTLGSNVTSDSATDSLECGDMQLKQVCNFGPLGACKWNNSAVNIGQFCEPGFLTDNERQNFQPPVNFCDDDLAKNNQTMCDELKSNWFMPCTWDSTDLECIFDWDSTGFGDEKGGDLNFWDINSEDTCVMAGGNWIKESYCDKDGNINFESWCEMGIGKGFEDCDDSCWACEWQKDGTDWASAGAAQTGCLASDLGYCKFSADNYAPNGLGWCDPADEIWQNNGNCDTDCMFCEFDNNPATACAASKASCEWANMTEKDGSTHSWCQPKNKQMCWDSCGECENSDACNQDGPGCTWDTTYQYCKPSVSNSEATEICFDGIDNDNDNDVDCADSNCAFDPFCGGDFMGDCHQYDEASCPGQTTMMGNCTWIATDWGEKWCGMPGENCWVLDDNATACDAENGCTYLNASDMPAWDTFCEINDDLADPCFMANNQSSCGALGSNCTWMADPWCSTPEGQNDQWCIDNPDNGWCDFFMFGDCMQHNSTDCAADANCNWYINDFFFDDFEFMSADLGGAEQGFCEPVCFELNTTDCAANVFCMAEEGLCEPDMFANDCWLNDGNQTACLEQNATCAYYLESYGPSVGAGEPNGICDPKAFAMMFQGMDPNPPIPIGNDAIGDQNGSAHVDISGYGLKDMGDKYGFGIMLVDITDAAFCKGYTSNSELLNGSKDGKYFMYIDTDEDATNGCISIMQDGSNETGFELLLKYVAEADATASKGVSETKSLMKCVDKEWIPTNVPIFADKKIMCKEINGVMFAMDKSELAGFDFYDSTNNLRFVVSSADANHTRGNPSDSADANWYTPGSNDFKFECCDCPGQDLDGDGLVSENDPDCQNFKKFGYTPKEDCWSAQDDDDDGLVNCNDADCMFEPICDGIGVNDAASQYYYGNDKTSPKVVWTKVEKFPDGAIIMYDTNEPSNGTVLFYGDTANCTSLNATLYDIGIMEAYMPEFKDWHDAPLDNFAFNSQALGYALTNGTKYYYKLKVCDPAGNCGTSACMHFKTAKTSNKKDCPACNPTFQFTPPPGMGMAFDFGNGYEEQTSACGFKKPYNETQQVNIKIDDAGGDWAIELINVSIKGTTLTDAAKAFESDDMKIDEGKETASGNITYVGMNDTNKKWDELKGAGIIPKKLRITFPKPDSGCTEFWHCDDTLTSCVNLTGKTGVSLVNETASTCTWELPPTYGFSVYGGSDYEAPAAPSGDDDDDSGSSGGGGGGGGGAATVYECRDGKDNDGDGLVDLNDTNCLNSRDNSEAYTVCTTTWDCTEFSECLNDAQSRVCTQSDTCAADLLTGAADQISEVAKPAESQACGAAAITPADVGVVDSAPEAGTKEKGKVAEAAKEAVQKATKIWEENTGKILLALAVVIGLALIIIIKHFLHGPPSHHPNRKTKRRNTKKRRL